MSTTIVRSWGAIALGLVFTGIAAWVLLWDLHGFGDLTTDHVQALAALAGTITAGHFAVSAMRQKLFLWGLMLGIAFCAGTFICIMGSAGRGAEVVERKAADANRSNDGRKDALTELAKARIKRDALADQFARECGSGRAGKCNGLKFALDLADSHAAILQVRADNAAPEQTANVKIKHAARMLAFFWQFDQARAEQGLELLWPVALPLVNEILAVAFFGIGFGHRVRTVRPTATVQSAKLNRETDLTARCGGSAAKDAAERDLVTYIALHGQIPSQDFLRERWGVKSKGTVSHWLAEWETKGLIVRVRDGKFKMTKLAN